MESISRKRHHDIIKDYIILIEHLDTNEEPMFYILGESNVFKEPVYFRFPIATEWCEENGIDPLNMSEEDIMAFKLRFL